MSFAHWTFEELNAEYAAACAWLVSLGVPVKGTRYDAIGANVDLFLESYRAQDASLFERDPEMRTGVFSLIEAREIIEIHQTFRGEVSPGLRQRLIAASKGPDAGITEVGNEGSGRDFLAEVVWAALLRRTQADVVLPSDSNAPDVVQRIPEVGRKRPLGLVWEVKRPRGPNSVRGALEKAADQIRKARTGEKPSGTEVLAGVPVIFMDYAIPEGLLVRGISQEDARHKAGEFLRLWAYERREEVQLYLDNDAVASVIYVWRPLGVCPLPGGRRAAAQQIIMVQREKYAGKAPTWARDMVEAIVSALRAPD